MTMLDLEKLVATQMGEQNTTSPDLIFMESEVDPDEVVVARPAISIGAQNVKGIQVPIPFVSYGDFACIVGPSKSMKTYLSTILTAGFMADKARSRFPSIRGHRTDEKPWVVHLDTEQSKFHASRIMKNANAMIQSRDKNYRMWQLRGYSARERFDFMHWLTKESPLAGEIGLLVVDGAADLVDDTNNLVESRRVVDSFMEITDRTGCALITVLHRNFGTAKPTGHIGSAILKRAETVAFVERDEDDIITVTPEYTRNYPFRAFKFQLDSDWLPVDFDVATAEIFKDDD